MPLAVTDSPLAVPRCPRVAVVLGSGLAELASLVQDAVEFNSTNIPGYPRPTTAGHGGRMWCRRTRVLDAGVGRRIEHENQQILARSLGENCAWRS